MPVPPMGPRRRPTGLRSRHGLIEPRSPRRAESLRGTPLVIALVVSVLAAACSTSTPRTSPPGPAPAERPTAASRAPGAQPPFTVAAPVEEGFATAVSANHRYLVDGHGQPYLLVGDSPQCLTTNLSVEDMGVFFADRQH